MTSVALRGVPEGVLGVGSVDIGIESGMTVADVTRAVAALDPSLRRPLLAEDGVSPRKYVTVIVDGRPAQPALAVSASSTIKVVGGGACDG